jgi:hypothetical protein
MNNYKPKFKKSKNQNQYIRSNNVFWDITPENEDPNYICPPEDCPMYDFFKENNQNTNDIYGSSYIQEYTTIVLEDFVYESDLNTILNNIQQDWKLNLDYIINNYNTNKYFNINNNKFVNNLKSRINNYFNSQYNIIVLLNKTSNLFLFIKFIFYSLKTTPEEFKENVINLLILTCSCYNILCNKYIYNYSRKSTDSNYKRNKMIHNVYYSDNCLNFIEDK